MAQTYFWFRRDLRLEDNAGLYHALRGENDVIPLFIFDKDILDKLSDSSDARVTFIHQTISTLKAQLNALGSDLIVHYGRPQDVWSEIIEQDQAINVYSNEDYEPYAMQRDSAIKALVEASGGEFNQYKDHIIFAKDEVLKADGNPYIVFTPYKRKWLERLGERPSSSYYFKSYPTLKYRKHLAQNINQSPIPNLEQMGFVTSDISASDNTVAQGIIKAYDQQRDFPALDATSKLGIHFRFGTISIREKARKALKLNATYLSELIWRDFYSQILAHFPRVVSHAFRAQYDRIAWRNDETDFEAWCQGQTGYPIVDAGMRQLNQTGYMHNRVRMIVASFLTKHLLIDWRWGEQYFADKLLDFDLASNNGGWQWAAGCGTDAAPYFRIFNPYTQQQKFDKQLDYVKKYVPEYGTDAYVAPIVDHKRARERCLETYKAALNT